MNVLLVDDETELVSTLAERLALRGHTVDWTAAPEHAIQMVKSTRYDLAILDVKMPKIGGLELMRILKDDDPSMKFILLTGHGCEETFEAAKAEMRTEYYLVKPVSISLLLEKMKEITEE